MTHSKAHDLAAPLDGITVLVSDAGIIRSDKDYAVKLGVDDKLVIDSITAALRPPDQDLDWARSVCSAVILNGRMIDATAIKTARRILAVM